MTEIDPLTGKRVSSASPSHQERRNALEKDTPSEEKTSLVQALIFGSLGALCGSLIWFFIGKTLNMEIGFLAWGVGLAAGAGVASKVPENDRDSATGMLAGALAIGGVVFGKYLLYSFVLSSVSQTLEETVEDRTIAAVAYEVYAEYEEEERDISRPPVEDMNDEELSEAETKDVFPVEVWEEAQYRWSTMSEEDRALYTQESPFDEDTSKTTSNLLILSLFLMPRNLLFLALAAGTAFKLGS